MSRTPAAPAPPPPRSPQPPQPSTHHPAPTRFPSPVDRSRLTPTELGREGENIAAEYLRVCGYTILDRNWRWRGPDVRGELDLVALAGSLLVAVEVKTRREGTGGRPFDAVSDARRTRLWKLATRWLAEHRSDPDFNRRCPGPLRGIRLDVIGLLFSACGRYEPTIEHLQAV
jgi:putative endonuclease